MLDKVVSQHIQQAAGKLAEQLDGYTGFLGSVKETILEHFGPNGLIAAYIAVAVLVLVLVSRLAKITFSAVKYLVVPAVVLAVVGSFFLPYSFYMLLPVTVTGCSLILLFKG